MQSLQRVKPARRVFFGAHVFYREMITFALLKATPDIKNWLKTLCDQSSIELSLPFVVTSTWESLRDVLMEQYYPFGIYEDKFMRWTKLRLEMDQAVLEFTNIFHTLNIKIGIKDIEKTFMVQHPSCFHKYI